MGYTQIGNIKLQYDETTVDIDRVIGIIKLNRYLFGDYNGKIISMDIPILSEKDNIVYISDFDQFFDALLKKLLKDNKVISALNHPDILPALYIQLLIKKAIQSKETTGLLDNNISIDMLWFMIASKFFDCKTNFSELSNFLKYRDDSERIFEWLKETQRFNAYNYILEILANYLKEDDLSFFNNLDEIFSKVTEESMTAVLSLFNESDYDLPKISLENFEEMFFAFLNSIKAPEEWKNLYIKLKIEKKILFEESVDGLNHSKVFLDSDGKRKIKVTNDGTINSFISLVHEFMHYVSIQAGRPSFSLSEFPSIYYERVAANYLIGIGYDENIMKQVIRDRNQDNFDIYGTLCGLLLEISNYNKKGPITREAKIEYIKRSMKEIFETKRKLVKIREEMGKPIEDLEFLSMPNYNYGELVDEECDEKISQFVKKGLLILNGYQYLINSYLANSILEKQDNNTLDKMIFITEHLADFNVEKIINYLGIENTFSIQNRSLKQ